MTFVTKFKGMRPKHNVTSKSKTKQKPVQK